MKKLRKMIVIDEELCNGCGDCIPACPEGALQIVDTPDGPKAQVVKESFCDGLGACLGDCPMDALAVVEKPADDYDEDGVIEHIKKNRPEVLERHMQHLAEHGMGPGQADAPAKPAPAAPHPHHAMGGCPGARSLSFDAAEEAAPVATAQPASQELKSELRQWPVQLHLVAPFAPYFKEADLMLVADCVPFAYANFHQDFVKDKALAIACPKLDDTSPYIDKLVAMIDQGGVKSITVAHMEVPCCSGLIHIAQQAVERAERKVPFHTRMVSIKG